jgi:hypothetical protein
MRRRLAVGVILATLGVLLAISACSPKKQFAPNVPPETVLFVSGPTDTVNHVVHFYWFGTDPDGEVTGFEWRILNPDAAADSAWILTTRTDSTFEIFDPTGYNRVTFEVRAIDDAGLRDPTPASNDSLQFRNRPTTNLTLIDPPSGANDFTYASVTLKWTASDPDGDALKFRVWLDGNEAAAITTTSFGATIPTAAFCQDGYLRSGLRTAFVQPIDNGGMAGTTASTTWFVRAPVGTLWPCGQRAKLLIVDDVPSTSPGNSSVDNLYRSAATAHFPDSAFSIALITSRGPFRSTKDLEQTLKLYDAVLWYRDIQTAVGPTIRDNESAIEGYLDAGGKIFIEGLYLVNGRNAPGALSSDFQARYLDSPGLYEHFVVSGSFGDTTAAWGNVNGGVMRSFALNDSLKFAGLLQVNGLPGLRAFAVRDTSEVMVWATDGALTPDEHRSLPIGVSVPQPSGGRAVVLTFPLRPANGYGTVPRFLDEVLQLFGVIPPGP